jgi:hypothetical protein
MLAVWEPPAISRRVALTVADCLETATPTKALAEEPQICAPHQTWGIDWLWLVAVAVPAAGLAGLVVMVA